MLWKLPNVRLAPDIIFHIGAFPVTNTLLCTWISIVILVGFFFFATRRHDMVPRGIQNLAEWAVEQLRGLAEGVLGKKDGRRFFSLAATLFLFILVANLLDVLPGVDTIGSIDTATLHALHTTSPYGPFLFGNISNALVPWIRPATTDLNLTFAMAIVAVVTAQVYGFYSLGAGRQVSKYFNFKALFKFSVEGFIEFFVGLLEIISELSRILSLAFRLFGNIFAGSVVLAVLAFILPFVADIIFIPFELFVAFIQALVFSLLTLVYLQLAVVGHESEGEHEQIARVEHAEGRETAAAH